MSHHTSEPLDKDYIGLKAILVSSKKRYLTNKPAKDFSWTTKLKVS